MARVPVLVGNWKMHCTRAEARALTAALLTNVGTAKDREVILAPPFTALEAVREAIAGSRIALAAQNVHWEAKGAFTGEIAPGMLKDAGCTHVIIGHSERRQYFGETNETVNQRLKASLAVGLMPIVCVGELLEEREAGATGAIIERQVAVALRGLTAEQMGACIIAYEPVWAIGTGRTATPQQAEEVHRAIRSQLGALASTPVAAAARILYGGSVKPDNIDTLMAQADIDGALVGGASLDAAQFTRIVQYR